MKRGRLALLLSTTGSMAAYQQAGSYPRFLARLRAYCDYFETVRVCTFDTRDYTSDWSLANAFHHPMPRNTPFPSALHVVKELRVNYRSQKKIVDFSQRIFRETVAQNALYAEAGERSGLTDYIQHVPEGREKGYAEVLLIERDDEHAPEKDMIQYIVNQLHTRGYRYRDIAILTQKNEDAVRATTWLNEKGIPFISYSSLDIRRRKSPGRLSRS